MQEKLVPPSALTLRDFSDYETDRTDPRAALMWPATRRDVVRIAEAVRATGDARALDVGAGSGLLARLLAGEGVRVRAVDPNAAEEGPVGRFHPVEACPVEDIRPVAPARVVSWMEAGADYRRPVAEGARVIVQAVDVGGGCGVRGTTSFRPFGFRRVAHWRTPSFENVAWARRTRGRGPEGRPLPRPRANRVEIWARDDATGRAVRERMARERCARPEGAYPWEAEMARLDLGPSPVTWE